MPIDLQEISNRRASDMDTLSSSEEATWESFISEQSQTRTKKQALLEQYQYRRDFKVGQGRVVQFTWPEGLYNMDLFRRANEYVPGAFADWAFNDLWETKVKAAEPTTISVHRHLSGNKQEQEAHLKRFYQETLAGRRDVAAAAILYYLDTGTDLFDGCEIRCAGRGTAVHMTPKGVGFATVDDIITLGLGAAGTPIKKKGEQQKAQCGQEMARMLWVGKRIRSQRVG